MNKKSIQISFLYGLFLLLIVGLVYAATVVITTPAAGSSVSAAIAGNGENITIVATVTLATGGGIVLDNNATNMSFYYRETGSANWILIGHNTTSNITTYTFPWKTNNLTEGVSYALNVTVENLTQSIGSVINTGLKIDNSPPGAALVALDPITEAEKTTFFFSDPILLRCTRDDPTSGFNYTNISVSTPGSSAFDFTEVSTATGTASASFDATLPGTATRTLGIYFAICGVLNEAGVLANSTNVTFEVVTKPPTGSTRPLGFVNPVGKKIISGEADLGRLTTTPISVQMRRTSTAKLDIGGRSYSFTVKDLSETSLTLVSGSTEITIAQGASSEADLDGDGTNDIKVTFHKQFKKGAKSTADVSFEAVTTQVKAPPKAKPSKADVERESAPVASSAGSLLVTVIVIIVIIVIGYFLIKGKKK